jgi:hypothetical protein
MTQVQLNQDAIQATNVAEPSREPAYVAHIRLNRNWMQTENGMNPHQMSTIFGQITTGVIR